MTEKTPEQAAGLAYALAEAMGEPVQACWEAAANAAIAAARPDTGMRLHSGEDWPVAADVKPDQLDEDLLTLCRTVHSHGQNVPAASLRRIGWLDQKGRVWTKIPPQAGFDGGSLTPLLIDAREDGH